MNRERGLRGGALIAGLLAVVAACSGREPQEPSLDGWPLGSEMSCEPVPNGNHPAEDIVAIAEGRLGSWRRPIASVACYTEGAYLENGLPILTTRSTLLEIVVFTFDDRSRHAIGVVCLVDSGCDQAKPGP